MDLDRRRCRRASEARDRRFDGIFFCGVVTTGIYCRPVCPVALPKPQNVEYYPSAAACEEAGFRPCRRCRPETAPGTPAWCGSSATVTRALRLIEEVSPATVKLEALSARLGVGSRHLRRLFSQHLGASPLAIMRTRRAHFARRLIDETTLPMYEVALAAGFSSVRQFNDSIHQTFGEPPTRLRKASRLRRPEVTAGEVALRLAYRPPFDWEGVLAFLAARAIPGVEAVAESAYQRVIATADGAGFVAVARDPERAQLIVRLRIADSMELARCVEATRRLFDLGANPRQIAGDLAKDPALHRRLEARPGVRVPGAWDPFELTVRAVLGQQVSVRGATTLSGRLVRSFGKPIDAAPAPTLTHLFPTPETLAEADVASIGLPRARAGAIRELARRVARGELEFSGAGSAESVMRRMSEIPGVGDWTAQYVAMRALGDSDAFPSGDLGLLRALSRGGKRLTPAGLRERAEAWRPWRAYAAMCLWG